MIDVCGGMYCIRFYCPVGNQRSFECQYLFWPQRERLTILKRLGIGWIIRCIVAWVTLPTLPAKSEPVLEALDVDVDADGDVNPVYHKSAHSGQDPDNVRAKGSYWCCYLSEMILWHKQYALFHCRVERYDVARQLLEAGVVWGYCLCTYTHQIALKMSLNCTMCVAYCLPHHHATSSKICRLDVGSLGHFFHLYTSVYPISFSSSLQKKPWQFAKTYTFPVS